MSRHTKKIIIYKIGSAGGKTVAAKCVMVNSVVRCDGHDALVQNLQTYGVYSKSENRQVFPSDGLPFLTALSAHFSSGHHFVVLK